MRIVARPIRPGHVLPVAAGALVIAAITVLSLDATEPLPAQIALGISLPVFYWTALRSIRPASGLRPRGRPTGDRGHCPAGAVCGPSEAERVRAWRTERLLALGVGADIASALARDSSLCVHDLERLLARGCPLATALRIVWPM